MNAVRRGVRHALHHAMRSVGVVVTHDEKMVQPADRRLEIDDDGRTKIAESPSVHRAGEAAARGVQ